jgi:hypothetical protein
MTLSELKSEKKGNGDAWCLLFSEQSVSTLFLVCHARFSVSAKKLMNVEHMQRPSRIDPLDILGIIFSLEILGSSPRRPVGYDYPTANRRIRQDKKATLRSKSG